MTYPDSKFLLSHSAVISNISGDGDSPDHPTVIQLKSIHFKNTIAIKIVIIFNNTNQNKVSWCIIEIDNSDRTEDGANRNCVPKMNGL